jgi:hypothetical protein
MIKTLAADRNHKSTRFGAVQLAAKSKHLSRCEVVRKTYWRAVWRDTLAQNFARLSTAGRVNKNHNIRAACSFGEFRRELMNTNNFRWRL